MVSLEIQGHNTYFYVFFFSRVVCLPRIEMSIISPEFWNFGDRYGENRFASHSEKPRGVRRED
jgi:hypothetical protein